MACGPGQEYRPRYLRYLTVPRMSPSLTPGMLVRAPCATTVRQPLRFGWEHHPWCRAPRALPRGMCMPLHPPWRYTPWWCPPLPEGCRMPALGGRWRQRSMRLTRPHSMPAAARTLRGCQPRLLEGGALPAAGSSSSHSWLGAPSSQLLLLRLGVACLQGVLGANCSLELS